MRGAFEAVQGDRTFRFSLLDTHHARLADPQPLCKLGSRHAKRFADGLDPAARRACQRISVEYDTQALVELAAGCFAVFLTHF